MSFCESQLSAPPTELPPDAFRGAAAGDTSSRVQIRAGPKETRTESHLVPELRQVEPKTRRRTTDQFHSQQASAEGVEAEQSDVTQHEHAAAVGSEWIQLLCC